jgi:hypothetical protein
MASDGNPGKLAITSVIHGSQAAQPASGQQSSGKSLPAGGKHAPPAPAAESVTTQAAADAATADAAVAARKTPPPPPRNTDPQSMIEILNKHLNDSGRPDQYRLDPTSGNKVIQQINPATGAVIGEFSVDEFPALARSVGATGLLIDSRA